LATRKCGLEFPRQRYLSANPEIRIVMQKHLACDLAGELASALGTKVDRIFFWETEELVR
jgi:hypothetical protein